MIDYTKLETSERPELLEPPYLPTSDRELIRRVVREYFERHRGEPKEDAA